MFHFEAFVLFEVSWWTSMRVSMILFKEPRRASVWMAVYKNMLWGRVNNNRCRMNNYWSRLYYH